MKKHRSASNIAGFILLGLLIAPIVILSVPTTGTEISFRPTPGSEDTYLPVYTPYKYVPIVEIVRSWPEITWTNTDRLLAAAYCGLYVLAFWLIRRRAKTIEPKEEPT